MSNIKRINNCLQRLCALRGRIAVGKWIPPTVVRAQLKQSKHARQVQQQFSQFKSLIRKKEKRQKFLRRQRGDQRIEGSSKMGTEKERATDV